MTNALQSAQISKRPFDLIEQLSQRDKAYQRGEANLRPFYKYPVHQSSFEQVIKARQDFATDRATLVQVLQEQHAQATPQQSTHIRSLGDPNTFTVITAHQPSLLTGPLYYIYKIASTIHLAKTLDQAYPDYRFVPVFVSGGEDHDFEEINHVHVFGKRLEWSHQAGGPVGRLTTDGLESVVEEMGEILGKSQYADSARDIIHHALSTSTTYGQFSRSLAQSLFGDYGLLIANMDSPALKRQFVPLMKRELLEQFSRPLITAAQAALASQGYDAQAHARPINLFYLGDGYRHRIDKEGDQYQVLNTDITWTTSELLQEVEEHPERFSPNVNMRPLYQELVFPNLAYIGGGGELAYWMERQRQFEAANVPYPMLVRRNSVLLLAKGNRRNMDKLDLNADQIWQPTHQLIDHLLRKASTIDIDVTDQVKAVAAALEDIAERASQINPGLGKYVLAEKTKQVKQVEQIGGRLKREVKQREEVKVKQLKALKEKLFPGGGLQERHDNIWQYYATYGQDLIDFLVTHLNPLDKDFLVIELD